MPKCINIDSYIPKAIYVWKGYIFVLIISELVFLTTDCTY